MIFKLKINYQQATPKNYFDQFSKNHTPRIGDFSHTCIRHKLYKKMILESNGYEDLIIDTGK